MCLLLLLENEGKYRKKILNLAPSWLPGCCKLPGVRGDIWWILSLLECPFAPSQYKEKIHNGETGSPHTPHTLKGLLVCCTSYKRT